MGTPFDKQGSGGVPAGGHPAGGGPRPDLKVGEIEIYGGQVVIGGVAVTPPFPGGPAMGAVPGAQPSSAASNPLPNRPPPAPSAPPVPPEGSVDGGARAVRVAPTAPVVSASPTAGGSTVPPRTPAVAPVQETALTQSREGVSSQHALQVGPRESASLDTALRELFPPISTGMGKLMVAGAGVGLAVGAHQLSALGLPAELVVPGAVGMGIWGLVRLVRAWRGGVVAAPAPRVELEHALVLLADRQGGVVRVVDVVRELHLGFDQAQALLTGLCEKGHAVVEFDAASQGPVYRIGG